MKKLISLLLLTIACVGAARAAAALHADYIDPDFECTHVTLRQGLPHNFVDCVYVDSRGFVWMGLGGGGLVRYDGYDFDKFSPHHPERYIDGNIVTSMAEDSRGRLWVGSDCGIDVIDVASAMPVCRADVGLSDLQRRIDWVAIDCEDRIWAVGRNCIWCMTVGDDGMIANVHQRAFSAAEPLNSQGIYDIDGCMYICHNGNVSVLRCNDAGIEAPVPVMHLADHLVVCDMLMHDGDLWVASNIGLYRCDMKNHIVKRLYRQDDGASGLSHNCVNALLEVGDCTLYAGTLNGVNAYNPVSDTFAKMDLRDGYKESTLASDFVNCLASSGRNMLVGTEGGGAVILSPRRVKATYHRFASSNPDSPYSPVNAIHEDAGQTLWVGAVEGGLAYRRKGVSEFTRLTTSNSPLPHNSVSALASDKSNGLWVGTWGNGLIVLDRSNPAKVLSRPALYSDNNELRLFIGALQYDPYNDGVWIGAREGLFFYDMKSGRVVRPIENSDGVNGSIGCVIDHNKHLWLGSYDVLYDIDLTSREGDKWKCRRLDCKLDRPGSGVRDHVTSLHVTRDGSLLVGSSVYGAYRRYVDDKGVETFRNVTTNDGLPHNSVMGILEDFQSNIWVSTYDGLGCYDVASKSWSRIGDLSRHSSQFYWNAYVFTSDGHLLFGSTDGMVDIDTSANTDLNDEYRVQFVGAMVDGVPSPLTLDSDGKSPCLSYKQDCKTLQVHFSALDYVRNPSYTYYYRLKGFDRDWAKLAPDRHEVTYTNLSPGRYQLEVAYNRNGVIKPMESSMLSIEVSPMLYNRWSFRVVCLLLIAGIGVWLYRRKTTYMAVQRVELERKVDERTSQLTQQKQALEQRNMQVQELTVDRLSFFTNITHEFRTPITLILGPLQQALRDSDNPKVTKQLKLVQRNAMYLLTLVNQLMDFRKIESGKVEILRRPGNFGQFLADTMEPFMPLAQDRSICLDTVCSLPADDINFDKEAMRKLIHNLVSNALKYTPDGGAVTVRAAVLPIGCQASLGTDYRKLYISVSDTGDGIDPKELNSVFDRFYQGKSNIKYPTSAGSSGIGLYLCKSIVEAYGGELTAKNGHGGGAVFRVVIPIPPTAQPEPDSDQGQPVIETVSGDGNSDVTLLVAEDNRDMLEYLAGIFEPHYTVLKARNGREALHVLASEKVDVIVSDLMMPEIDGMELTKAVKSNLSMSHIPILMLTAKTNEATQLESYREGVDAFVEKPFSPQVLLGRIANIVNNKKRYQRAFAINYKVDANVQAEETRDQKFMRQVMAVVDANYRNSYFEVGDFAEELGVSRSFLNKKLQALIGQSASQLVKNYRMKLAYDKIVANRASRSYTISEIAYDVGFNDSKYFAKCFAKEYGITPSGLLNEDAGKSK